MTSSTIRLPLEFKLTLGRDLVTKSLGDHDSMTVGITRRKRFHP